MDRLAAITVNITDRGVDFLKEEIDLKEKFLILNHVFKYLFIFHPNFLCCFCFLFFAKLLAPEPHLTSLPTHSTQASSNAHISSCMCPEGMLNVRHLWLAGSEGWMDGEREKERERGRKVLSLTPSLCAANTGTN